MVVLSSVLSNDAGCSNPLLGYSNEPVNIVGLNDRLPMVFFLALSVVQIVVIVSGNENQIMVRIISTLLFWFTKLYQFLKVSVFLILLMYILGQHDRYAWIIFLPGIRIGIVEKRCCLQGPNKQAYIRTR